jgi:hypothetical protein
MARTKREQEWALDSFAEREHLREIAQTLDCHECAQPVGKPCVNRVGEPLGRADHTSRLNRATAHTVDCPGCSAPTGQPCVNRVREQIGRMGYHASRLNRAQAKEDR